MIRKQYLLQCFLSIRALDSARNEKYLSSAYKITFFSESKCHGNDSSCKQLNHATVKPKRGKENFRCVEGPSKWKGISLSPDGGDCPLPPVSFFAAPCFPKWLFPLLLLREVEQEGLEGRRKVEPHVLLWHNSLVWGDSPLSPGQDAGWI